MAKSDGYHPLLQKLLAGALEAQEKNPSGPILRQTSIDEKKTLQVRTTKDGEAEAVIKDQKNGAEIILDPYRPRPKGYGELLIQAMQRLAAGFHEQESGQRKVQAAILKRRQQSQNRPDPI